MNGPAPAGASQSFQQPHPGSNHQNHTGSNHQAHQGSNQQPHPESNHQPHQGSNHHPHPYNYQQPRPVSHQQPQQGSNYQSHPSNYQQQHPSNYQHSNPGSHQQHHTGLHQQPYHSNYQQIPHQPSHPSNHPVQSGPYSGTQKPHPANHSGSQQPHHPANIQGSQQLHPANHPGSQHQQPPHSSNHIPSYSVSQPAPHPDTPESPLHHGSLEDKLRLAASKGLCDEVLELIQTGATSEPDKDGRTALQYAALNGHAEVCKLLLQYNAEKDIADALGYTAFHRAATQGHAEVIEVLAEAGCDVNKQDKNGNTALHEAAWNGFSKTVEMLVKHEVDSFLPNKGGFTALHLASQNGHNESTRVLLYAGCNADLKNNYGDTALHTAARYGHAGVTRILLSARCRINEQNKILKINTKHMYHSGKATDINYMYIERCRQSKKKEVDEENGDTALHIASALKRRKIAKLLVEASVDTQITNKQNETAMDVAKRKEHPEIIIIIQSFSRPKTPKSPRPPSRAHPSVSFKDEIEVDGPVVVPTDEPPIKEKQEKEKRFFFFKKKKKDKDKDKEKTPPGKSQIPGGQIPRPGQPGHQCNPGEPWRPVQGFFSQYVPKTGVQYYRDLAGNIKQGPVGYAPLCQCGPALKNMDQKIETTRENMVDHVNASNKLLKDQIEHLDKRTAQQVYSIDRLTKERMENEHNLCHNRISERLRHERHDTKKMFNQYNEQIQTWLDTKLASYGHCLSHHHDDSALPPSKFFTDFHENENGRLFRSRSDETLSVSDYSGKHRKKDFYESRQEAMQLIRAWQLPNYRQSVRRRERNNNVIVTNAEVHGKMDRVADGASPKYEGSPSRQMMMGHQQGVMHAPVDVSAIKRETGNQGAIPKRMPHSHSWQNHRPSSREASPQIQGHSREASPFDTRPGLRPIVRSHTDNIYPYSSTPKQTLPERGPPNVRSKPGAPEVPPKPLNPGTGQAQTSGAFSRPSSYHQTTGYASNPGNQTPSFNPGHQTPTFNQRNPTPTFNQRNPTPTFNQRHPTPTFNQRNPTPTFNQRNSQAYMTVEASPPTTFKPRSQSTDTMLSEDNGGFPGHVTRSKSLDRTIDAVDRNGDGVDRNMNPQSGDFSNQRQSGFQQVPSRRGVTYRVPPSPTIHLKNGPQCASQTTNRNSISGYRESPYASAQEMQRVANNVHSSAPSPRPGFQAYEGRRNSGRESNYADISQFSKDRPPHRSMHGINADKGNYSNYESVPMRSPVSKSETNLTKDCESADTKRPNKPPPYGYRYGDAGAKGSGNPGNSANNNNNVVTNYNLTGYNSHVHSPNNNVPMRNGSVTPVSGHYGNSKPSEQVVNHSNHSNSSDGFNVSQTDCLHHDNAYQRNSVYNQTYSQNKEDSTCSSNQDSGYSSKAKFSYNGQSPDGLPSNSGTPSSSFSMDRSISTGTPSQTNSPFVPNGPNSSPFPSSPFTPVRSSNSPFPKESTPVYGYSGNGNYEQSSQDQPSNVQNHVNGWYQKKLLEAAEKLRNSEQYSGAHNYSPAPINYDPVNGSDV